MALEKGGEDLDKFFRSVSFVVMPKSQNIRGENTCISLYLHKREDRRLS
jgi:hypothetical protein